ncbi:MAG: BadF/BadG/BcrA/BcrD type ATPase [Chloroflexota bacterium]|nr:BadF/BadG/BcrA/BcrD type ATPase [Chloroflexota bacterium]
MDELVLGVDGGGSKTRALVADASGKVLGSGGAESSNYQSVGFGPATDALRLAIDRALQAAGVASARPFAAACFGLAGVDRPGEGELFEQWIAAQGLARLAVVVNDAELVLAGGTPAGSGIALICGTGSIAYGRAPDGRTARAGGWGHLLGDEGSGYDIGVQALRLAARTADGRADAADLLHAVLAGWQLDHPSQLIGYCYRPEMTRAEIAGLARQVIALAEQGDVHARLILERAADELGRVVAAVMRQLTLERPPIALGGGLLGPSSWLQRAVLAQHEHTWGPAQYVGEPAIGAVIIARRLVEQPSAPVGELTSPGRSPAATAKS